MNCDDVQGMSLQEIADLMLEPVTRVRRALKKGPELRVLVGGRNDWERRYELRSVVQFVAFYRRWEEKLRREKKERAKKAEAARYASDPRALLRKARTGLARASADIATASKAMRHEGLVPIQFLGDARLKPREPFMVSLSVRGSQGKLLVAEISELGLSVTGRTRTAALNRLRMEIEDLYWRLKAVPEAEPARWATLQQMIEEREGAGKTAD
jgi:hypothetical protein